MQDSARGQLAASRSALKPLVIAVVGPTAAGKSALGVALAQTLGGEVINADSMQLYAGMDIGTAKLTLTERDGVPHHLLDVWKVTEPASVAEYQRMARAAIDSLLAAARVPILVGGSGLYLQAALDRFEFPGTDSSLRADLEARLAAEGPAVLHAELAVADPVAAERILPSNGRRIVRALEVVTLTGQPFAAALPEQPEPIYPTAWLGVDLPVEELDERVEARVDRMWAAGLVDEVRTLEGVGLRSGRTSSRALGYQQVLRQLSGELTEGEARSDTVRATRRFIRRQRAWFRRDGRVQWLSDTSDFAAEAVALIRSVESA